MDSYIKKYKTENDNNIYIYNAEKFKTTSISLVFSIPADTKSISYLNVLSHILKYGCKAFPSTKALNGRLQNLYGTVFDCFCFKKGKYGHIVFSMDIPDKDIKKAFILLSKIINEPCAENGEFSKRLLSCAKCGAERSLNTSYDDTAFLSLLKCQQKISELTENEAFGINPYGDKKEIADVDEKELFEFYKNIINKAAYSIFICTNKDSDDIKCLSEKHFSFLGKGKENYKTNLVNFKNDKAVNISDKAEISQSRLCIAYSTDENDIFKLLLFNEIFGSGNGNLLFNTIREKNHLCYSVSSKLYIESGIIIVQCGLEKASIDKAIMLTDKVLESISKINFDDEIFKKSKFSLKEHYLSLYDEPDLLAGFIISEEIFGINYSPNEFADKFESISKEDISNTAKTLNKQLIYTIEGK